jgi:hypothetical protein
VYRELYIAWLFTVIVPPSILEVFTYTLHTSHHTSTLQALIAMSSVTQGTEHSADEATRLRRVRVLQAKDATQAEIDQISTQTFPPLPTESDWERALSATKSACDLLREHSRSSNGPTADEYLKEMLRFNSKSLDATGIFNRRFPIPTSEEADTVRTRMELIAQQSGVPIAPQFPHLERISANPSELFRTIFGLQQSGFRDGSTTI